MNEVHVVTQERPGNIGGCSDRSLFFPYVELKREEFDAWVLRCGDVHSLKDFPRQKGLASEVHLQRF